MFIRHLDHLLQDMHLLLPPSRVLWSNLTKENYTTTLKHKWDDQWSILLTSLIKYESTQAKLN